MKKIISILVVLLLISAFLYSAERVDKPQGLHKTSVFNSVWMDVNRMNGVFNNNGTWFYDYVTGDWGLEWPKGSGLSPIFAAGQYVGAMVDGEPRVAGVQHSASEFQSGEILNAGAADSLLIASDFSAAEYRWYVLESGDHSTDDWNNWPVNQGAPLDTAGNPLLIGDMSIFSVWNDMADHTEYNTKKLGVEVRQYAFAFNRADAIGDMIFVKWQLINKSSQDWDDTYFIIWSDPDLGDAGDDLVGCDTTLGLGYCYNAGDNDQNYGGAPPAAGIDFFQGPIIDSPDDTVSLPDGSVLIDKTMLKMTSFIFYNNDDSPQGNPQSGSDVWNYMRGYWRNGQAIVDDGANGTGDPADYPKCPFMFTGNPETGEGWMDSNEADRRFMMTTGPFTMKKWDDLDADGMPEFGEPGVQEIVAGVLVGRGSNNLNSVSYLKAIDEIAQLAYDINFELPPAPKQPVVNVSELSNEVVLTWDDRSEFMDDGVTPYSIPDIVANGLVGQKMVVGNEYKEVTDGTFDFTGYTVYQYSDASGRDPVVYANLGVEEIEDSTPYVGARYVRILVNKNSVVGNVGDPLVNGKEYFFGITANSYCEFAIPQVFTSSPAIVSVVPQAHPGERYNASYNDTLDVEYAPIDDTKPAGDGSVTVVVVDPSAVTGHDYKVAFTTEDDESVTWDVIDVTLGDTVLADQTNQEDNDAYTIADGLMVVVAGPPPGIKSIVELDPNTLEVYDSNLWGSLNNYGRSQGWPVMIIHESSGLDLARVDRFGTMTPKDYEVIFTDDDSTLAYDYYYDTVLRDAGTSNPSFLPFTFWRIDLDGTRTRLAVCVLDEDGSGTWNRVRDGLWGPAFELLYVYDNAEYNPADVETYISTDDGTVAPGYGPWGVAYPAINRLCFAMYVDLDGYATADMLDDNGYFWGPPHAGEYVRINTNKPNTSNDVFTFTAPAAKSITSGYQKEDLKKIKVVPNPYYGYHSGEMNIFERWVQFTYLPEECTIRIFDLSGNQIRKLEKDDPSTTFMRWDLSNEYELPVASSIYIYHVDVPGVGEKVGKIAVFTPNERLDTY